MTVPSPLHTPATAAEWQPRAVCWRCARPARVCWCAHVPALDTRTRLLIVQHPREEFVAIGTGRMTSLCLRGSELVVGVEVEHDARVRAALDDPTRTPVLLWPGPGARDLGREPPAGPVTLVVVDGTWSLAKQLVRKNPRLAALPRYALEPPTPSEYRIRPEPAEQCVSTLEAVMHALGILEGDPDRFHAMLTPFRAMVDTQLEHQTRLQGARIRTQAKKRKPRHLDTRLRAEASLVVVGGEANAWPRRPVCAHPDELIHWLAVRVATGERFEAVVAPKWPLSPSTPEHTRLSAGTIRAGIARDELVRRWRAFVRDDDVICGWGHYAAGLLLAMGGFLPRMYVDLRSATSQWLRGKPGSIEAYCERIEQAPRTMGLGRGGERLALAWTVARHLVTSAP